MTRGILSVDGGSGPRRLDLSTYLSGHDEEWAAAAANAWIKALRHLPVDGEPMRRHFLFRHDSLWWFAELYLHKRQAILGAFQTIRAIARLLEREDPRAIRVVSGDRVLHGALPQMARARKVACTAARGFGGGRLALARLDLRARVLMAAASLSRLRARSVPDAGESPAIVAFVHRAFWRSGGDEGSAESYIGPVLQSLSQRFPGNDLRYVGVGPSANFRARRWWHALRPERGGSPVVPIEAYAPSAALEPSAAIWRDRHDMRRALWASEAIRRHAVIEGVDCWPIVREELAGVALLQWPWSARAMDEAGAALDRLRPGAALTYAEAGGWGRALMLECRRRGIPSAGLQHGFIYRHWLNYLHEPDEMAADPGHGQDTGFPRPTLTLLFDSYAAAHLEREGRFPADSLAVTGSPRLDALAAEVRTLTNQSIARAREQAGAQPADDLVVLVTKYREARNVLPALAAAVAGMPRVRLAIKTHPAETPDAYEPVAAAANIRVLPATAPLAPLLGASRAVVTVNSTVALDAAVLGVPALVIGLPNNLSPFVDAGAMAGADHVGIRPALERILYDEGFRRTLSDARNAFLARYAIGSDGCAAERSAEAIARLIRGR